MILVILIVLLVFGGVGYRWDGYRGGGIGLGGVVLLILLLWLLFGGFGHLRLGY